MLRCTLCCAVQHAVRDRSCRTKGLLNAGADVLGEMVPLAGIEPALLAELDFESSASTSSATGARAAEFIRLRSARTIAVPESGSTRRAEATADTLV